MPYFLKDNPHHLQMAGYKIPKAQLKLFDHSANKTSTLTALEKAELRHKSRTPEQINEIRARAQERQNEQLSKDISSNSWIERKEKAFEENKDTNKALYLQYDISKWERTYYSEKSNGFVVTEKKRITEANASKNEMAKFEKELKMCRVCADNGYRIEFLHGVGREVANTYDIRINEMKADLKCITGGASNLVKYVKKALNEQGGEAVVLEIPNGDTKYYNALAEARRKCEGRIFFYITRDNDLKEVHV